MTYRDDLEAAQRRIAELEGRVREMEGDKEAPPPVDPLPEPPRRGWAGATLLGVPIGIVLLAGSCALGQPLCGRACGSMSGGTEPAMAALRSCPAAREALGDDVGWGVYGCANCESEGGGDPMNGGCHSSSDWQMPVSGNRGRGTYRWSFSQPPGQKERFTGGQVTLSDGRSIGIGPNGCD